MMYPNQDLKFAGFTMIELMVTIAILGIITMVALPRMGEFSAKLTADNQASELNRLLLTARNTAINEGLNVTICPLNGSNKCTNNWQNEISVFTDNNNNQTLETGLNERLIKVKAAISTNDKLQFGTNTSLTYTPSGRTTAGVNNTFNFCPYSYATGNRGVVVTVTGKSYLTSDIDNDGKDEDRSGTEIVCS